MPGGAAAAATNAGIGVSGVEASTRTPARQLGRVAGDQQVPVGIERPDVDAPVAHGVEHVARGHEIALHLRDTARVARACGRQAAGAGTH